jgi:hypothetical protein
MPAWPNDQGQVVTPSRGLYLSYPDDRELGWFSCVGRGHAVGARGGHRIPYGALLPKGIDGLLVAGRCISAWHKSLGGFRGMGSVMNIGQAAGVPAALAAGRGVTPRQVGADEIQAVLASFGITLL